MPILNIFTTQLGQGNSKQRLVRVHCNDTLAQVTTKNYLNSYLTTHAQNVYAADSVLVSYTGGEGLFTPIFTGNNLTLEAGIIFNAGILSGSNTSGITALSGGGQTGATLLTSTLNQISTVANANDSVLLPVTSTQHPFLMVANAAASNSCNVYPQTGDAINALSANSPFALAAGKNAVFFSPVAGHWYVVLSV